jgi:hypothetical protein
MNVRLVLGLLAWLQTRQSKEIPQNHDSRLPCAYSPLSALSVLAVESCKLFLNSSSRALFQFLFSLSLTNQQSCECLGYVCGFMLVCGLILRVMKKI